MVFCLCYNGAIKLEKKRKFNFSTWHCIFTQERERDCCVLNFCYSQCHVSASRWPLVFTFFIKKISLLLIN